MVLLWIKKLFKFRWNALVEYHAPTISLVELVLIDQRIVKSLSSIYVFKAIYVSVFTWLYKYSNLQLILIFINS